MAGPEHADGGTTGTSDGALPAGQHDKLCNL